MMNYKSENKYKVSFKDGSFIERDGESDSINKSPVIDELEWFVFLIQKDMLSEGKTLEDILKIEYSLKYTDGTN